MRSHHCALGIFCVIYLVYVNWCIIWPPLLARGRVDTAAVATSSPFLITQLKRYFMKLRLLIVVAAVSMTACEPVEQKQQEAQLVLETQEQKVSYGMGLSLAERLKQDNLPLDTESFLAAMGDVFEGREPLMTEEQMADVLQTYQQQQMAQMQEKLEAEATVNQAASDEFLAANATKEGIVSLDSGLQYKILESGDGATPGANDTVEVHYRGTLIDGTEFDSSYGRGETVSFPVNAVIPGWTEALQLMPVGSKWELYIPSELAYGAGGTSGVIGPNSALVFEVQLISIVPASEG